MVEFSFALLFISFIAGFLTFFAPCTFPLIPAFLGIIAGVRQDELQDPEQIKGIRGKIFTNAIFYVLGFSVIFVFVWGVGFSLIGQLAGDGVLDWIERIGGALVILFGLFLMGVLKIDWLNAKKEIHADSLYQKSSKANSFGLGALFALGWSPCVGPILGSISVLASTQGTVLSGTVLLVAFAAGLAVPFLVTALLVSHAMKAFTRMDKAIKIINIVAGVFLIFLGYILLTGSVNDVFGWVQSKLGGLNFFEEFLLRFNGGLE